MARASGTDGRPPRPARLRRWPVVGLVTLLVVGLVAGLARPAEVRLRAAGVLIDALDLPIAGDERAVVVRRHGQIAGVEVDVYARSPGTPVVVLVPGATPAGRDDRRAVRLAEAIARAQRTVIVPELEVYGEDLVPEDVDRLVRVTRGAVDAGTGPVVLLGISFGGSLALLAAADERLAGDVALVAVFGAYLDLVGVVQAATTGVALVGDERIPWQADPRAADIVRDRLVELLPADQRRAVTLALDGALPREELPDGARAVHDVLVNDDPARTFALAEALPEPIRARIAAVSPASVADRLDVPVVAMHATDDPAVPVAELDRLGAAIPHARLHRVDSFEHVDLRLDAPGTWRGVVRDLTHVWRFAVAVLDAQPRR